MICLNRKQSCLWSLWAEWSMEMVKGWMHCLGKWDGEGEQNQRYIQVEELLVRIKYPVKVESYDFEVVWSISR